MRGLLRISLALTLTLFSFADAAAGAWTLNKHKKQHILTYRSYATVAYFSGNGTRRDKLGRYDKQEVNLYHEYGLQDYVTLGASLFVSHSSDVSRANAFGTFQEISPANNSVELSGLRRTELFIRTRLYNDNGYVLSIQPMVSIPGYYPIRTKNSAISDAFEWGGDGLLGTNFSLFGRTHFTDISAGYRIRGDGLGDQYKLHAGIGLNLNDDWTLLPEIDTTIAASGIHLATTTITGQNDYDLTKAQISAIYKFNEHIKFQAGGYKHIAGRNTGAGGGGLFSVWISL